MAFIYKYFYSYLDKQKFVRHQVDYFVYLSHLLAGARGTITMRTVFAQDISRYGVRHFRGRLAQQWLLSFEKNGGDLALTWKNWVPHEVWLFIRLSQQQGNDMLVLALQQIAQQLQQRKKIQQELLLLLAPALAAIAVCSLMLFAIPFFTVPNLRDVFAVVPVDLYGAKTTLLFSFSSWLQDYGLLTLFFVFLSALLVGYSLGRTQGRLRSLLDHCEPWQTYKLSAGWQLIALLALLLKHPTGHLSFASALALLFERANPWFKNYLVRIQKRIAQGDAGARSLDVGLLPKDVVWFMQDLEQCQGIAQALQSTAERQQWLLRRRLVVKAQLWRWLILLACVLFLLGLGGWHYIVMDEFRKALLLIYTQ